jgi:alkylation response protein AidB-like acyl-CoA dehydrogenase
VLENFAPAAVKSTWLPKMASGAALLSLAHQERASRHSLEAISATFGQVVDGFVDVVATKRVAIAAAHAQAFVVSGLLNGKPALALVEASAPGVGVSAYTLQDGTAAGDVRFDHAKGTLITADGLAALALAQDLGIATQAAYAVGAMERTLSITTEYMNTRKQFGTVLSSFQALRHRAADMKMALELARSMSMYASLKLGAAPAERSMACSRAKVQLGRSMRQVSQEAVQLHGGIGVTNECNVSHYFRVLTSLELQQGDTLHHLGQVSAGMSEQAGVFA